MSVMRHCPIALRWLIAGVVDPCPHACRSMQNGWRVIVATGFDEPNDLATESTDRLLPSPQPTSNGCARPQSP